MRNFKEAGQQVSYVNLTILHLLLSSNHTCLVWMSSLRCVLTVDPCQMDQQSLEYKLMSSVYRSWTVRLVCLDCGSLVTYCISNWCFETLVLWCSPELSSYTGSCTLRGLPVLWRGRLLASIWMMLLPSRGLSSYTVSSESTQTPSLFAHL